MESREETGEILTAPSFL